MYYKLTIEDDSGKKIEISHHQVIQKVDIILYQNDNRANDRSDQVYADVTISGVLDDRSRNEAKEIFNWSTKTSRSEIYRTVSIQAYDDQEMTKCFRDYYFKVMFCFSYEEHFAHDINDKALDSFCLKLKQRKGEINTIVVE